MPETDLPGGDSRRPRSYIYIDLAQVAIGVLVHLRLIAELGSNKYAVYYGVVRQEGSHLQEGTTSEEPDQVTNVVILPESPDPYDDSVQPFPRGAASEPVAVRRHLSVGDEVEVIDTIRSPAVGPIRGRIDWIATY